MAIPKTAPQTPASNGPALAQPALARGDDLTLTRSSEAWTYWGNPMVLQCMQGKIVPQLAKALFTPGLNGNGKHRSRGEGWGRSMAEQGYVAIPHDIECVAFGKPRRGELSNYFERIEATGHVLHVEAWRRPRVIGRQTLWTAAGCFDEAGWIDFHVRCMAIVSPGELDEAQIEQAMAPLLREIKEARSRSDDRAKLRLAKLLSNVPLAYAPRDIKSMVEAAQAA